MLRMPHNEKMPEIYIHANFMLDYGKWWHLLFYQLEKINYGIKAEFFSRIAAQKLDGIRYLRHSMSAAAGKTETVLYDKVHYKYPYLMSTRGYRNAINFIDYF